MVVSLGGCVCVGWGVIIYCVNNNFIIIVKKVVSSYTPYVVRALRAFTPYLKIIATGDDPDQIEL